MKESWFFFPLNYLLRAMGGIAVPRRRGSNLGASIVEKFNNSETLNLAVTPEGTRSPQADWRKGFIYMATEANVPIQLGVIDYMHKHIIVKHEFHPTGNVDEDLRQIKLYYRDMAPLARYPLKFLT